MLAPNEPRDFEQTFAAHSQGMTATPVTAAALLDVRERLLNRIAEFLDAKSNFRTPPNYLTYVANSPT